MLLSDQWTGVNHSFYASALVTGVGPSAAAWQLVDIWHKLCRRRPEACGAPGVHQGGGEAWNETALQQVTQ